MKTAVRRLLAEHSLVSPGQAVLVGLSGGSDSVALLHLLSSLSSVFPFKVFAAHLDHGIRLDSGADLSFLQAFCESLHVPLVTERVDVPALAARFKTGLEDAGRRARRDFLLASAERLGCERIALGHHRGDQAETFLHRLLRGAGSTGLSAMQLQNGSFIRPLLDFSRNQIECYLQDHGLSFLEDPTNSDPAFTRNRIRHQLLPELRTYNPRIEEHLCRLAQRFAQEEDYWKEQEGAAFERVGCRQEDGGVVIDRLAFMDLHPALRPRVLRRALEVLRAGLHGIGSLHIESVESLVFAPRPQAEVALPGAWVSRRYDKILFRLESPAPPQDFDILVEGEGDFPLPDGRVLRVILADKAVGEGVEVVEYCASDISFPFHIRNFRQGDRFRPSGSGGSKKLKKFFIDAKMDRETRCSLPLIVAGEVLWVAGVRRCEGFRPSGSGKPVLRLALVGGAFA